MAYSFAERRAHRGSGYSYTPSTPGSSVGNVGAVQPLTPQQEFRKLLPPGLQGDYDRFIAQGGDFKKYDVGAAQERFNTQRTADQTFEANQPKPETPAATEEYNADKDFMSYLRGLNDPTAQRERAQTYLDIQKQLMDYGQEKGKESAKEAFKYEMLGRIPDTIGAALAGQGQLMREGSRDIANIMLSGMQSIPEPRAAANNYQRPTFRYFQ